MTKAKWTLGDCDDEVIQFPDFDAEVFRDLYQRQTVRYRYLSKTERGGKGASWTDAMPGAKDRVPQIAANLAQHQNGETIDADRGFGGISGVRLYNEIIVDHAGEIGTLAVMRLPSYFTAVLFFEDGRWCQIDKHVKTNSQTVFHDSDGDEDFLGYVRMWLCMRYMLPDFHFGRELLAEAREAEEPQAFN